VILKSGTHINPDQQQPFCYAGPLLQGLPHFSISRKARPPARKGHFMRSIKKAINQHAHREGVAFGHMKRAELLARLDALQATGKPLEEICLALGIPMPTGNDSKR